MRYIPNEKKLDTLKSYVNGFIRQRDSFNKFANITGRDILEIRRTIKEIYTHEGIYSNNFEWKIRLFAAIIDKRSVFSLDSFDKKVIFLIEGLDPTCYIKKRHDYYGEPYYKKSEAQIKKEPKAKQQELKQELLEKRNIFKNEIISKYGLFIKELIAYEHYYLNKLNKYHISLYNPLNDAPSILSINTQDLDLSTVSKEDIQRIEDSTPLIPLISITQLSPLLQSISYEGKRLEERIIELIMKIDKDLQFLQIYEDSCRDTEIISEVLRLKRISISDQTDKQLFYQIVKLERILKIRKQMDYSEGVSSSTLRI